MKEKMSAILIVMITSVLSCNIFDNDCDKINKFYREDTFNITIEKKSRKGRRFYWEGVDSLNKKIKEESISGFLAELTDSLAIGDKVVKRQGELVYLVFKKDRVDSFYRPVCK